MERMGQLGYGFTFPAKLCQYLAVPQLFQPLLPAGGLFVKTFWEGAPGALGRVAQLSGCHLTAFIPVMAKFLWRVVGVLGDSRST
jgi:hypothetical protein